MTAVSTTRSAPMVSDWKLESPGVSMQVVRQAAALYVGQRRGQAELTPLLVVVPVADRGAVFDLAESRDDAAAEQKASSRDVLPVPR